MEYTYVDGWKWNNGFFSMGSTWAEERFPYGVSRMPFLFDLALHKPDLPFDIAQLWDIVYSAPFRRSFPNIFLPESQLLKCSHPLYSNLAVFPFFIIIFSFPLASHMT